MFTSKETRLLSEEELRTKNKSAQTHSDWDALKLEETKVGIKIFFAPVLQAALEERFGKSVAIDTDHITAKQKNKTVYKTSIIREAAGEPRIPYCRKTISIHFPIMGGWNAQNTSKQTGAAVVSFSYDEDSPKIESFDLALLKKGHVLSDKIGKTRFNNVNGRCELIVNFDRWKDLKQIASPEKDMPIRSEYLKQKEIKDATAVMLMQGPK